MYKTCSRLRIFKGSNINGICTILHSILRSDYCSGEVCQKLNNLIKGKILLDCLLDFSNI